MGSVAVGDVPGSELALGTGCLPLGEPCLLVSGSSITDRLTAAVLSDDLLSVGVQDGGHVQGGVLHVANIRDAAGFGKRCGRFAEWFGGIAKGAGVL